MRPLRIFMQMMGCVLLVLAGVLMVARPAKPADRLLAWESVGKAATLYRVSLDDQAPEAVLSIAYAPNSPLWVKVIDGRMYFEEVANNAPNHLYRTTLNGYDRESVLPENAHFLTFSPNDQWLYYAIWETATSTIYRLHLESGKHESVVQMDQGVACQFSPQGQWLACESRTQYPRDIHLMRANGSALHDALLGTPLEHLGNNNTITGWSPDGQWLLFWSEDDGDQTLYRIRPDGSGLQAIGDGPFPALAGWSRDGQALYYQTYAALTYRLERIALAAEPRTTVLAENYLVRLAPQSTENWLYLVIAESGDEGDIYRIREDGSEVQRVSSLPGREFIHAPSPDGRWLYFSGLVQDTLELVRIDLNTMQAEPLTDTVTQAEYRGFWSPDGQWFVYMSENLISGQERIMAMRPDGTQPRPIFAGQPDGSGNLSQQTAWFAPPDFAWHTVWLLMVGAGLLALACLRPNTRLLS